MKVLAGALLLAVAAACSVGPAGLDASPAARGRETRELVVQDYITGLERSDAAAITLLISPQVDASRDIAAAVRKSGGQPLRDVETTYLDEFGGKYVVATVVGVGANDGEPHEVRVPIARVGSRYYLALGEAAPNGSEANPRSP
jgi:hypothetical protein